MPRPLDEALAFWRKITLSCCAAMFTEERVETFIEYESKNEVEGVRSRPHPYEFALYCQAWGTGARGYFAGDPGFCFCRSHSLRNVASRSAM
jgi:hypothetical protein